MTQDADKLAEGAAEAVLRHARGNTQIAMQLAKMVCTRLTELIEEETWRAAEEHADGRKGPKS